MGIFGGIGGLLGGAAALGSSLYGAYSANRAADAQEEAAQRSSGLQERIYADTRRDLAPYQAVGKSALNKLRDIYLTGETPFQTTPGYDFRLNQGIEARDRSAAARGRLFSGAQQKALTDYGQGVASQEYNNEFNRLGAISGIGQTATNTGVSAGQNYGAQQGRNYSDAGAARASSYVGSANALSGGVNNALSLYALSRYM